MKIQRIIKRLLLALFAPATLLFCIEWMLRLANYGQPTSLFIPTDTPGILRTNERYAWRFMPPALARTPVPLRMSARKAAGTTRIFVLGSSAAQGFPDPAYGVGRFLEVMLANAGTGRVEVINAAMTGMNSHVVRAIAEECAKYQPDYFVVYCGNNEVIGPFGPGTVFKSFEASEWMIRLQVWFSGTRTSQAMRSIATRFHQPSELRWGGMAMFAANKVAADDPRLPAVYDHFRENLSAICAIARDAGAKTLICTVLVNLRDFPPLASTNRHGIESAQQLFDSGRFQEACDADLLRFRADSRINAVVREVAAKNTQVALVDLASQLDCADAFYEHVHLNLNGSYRAAATICSAMNGGRLVSSFESCRAALAATVFDEYRIHELVMQLCSEPPFTMLSDFKARQTAMRNESARLRAAMTQDALAAARATYDAAIRARLDDASLMWNCAEMMTLANDRQAALQLWQRVVQLNPEYLSLRGKLALALAGAGQRREAVAMFEDICKHAPDLPVVHKSLGDQLLLLGETKRAESLYREAIRAYPAYADALLNLAGLCMREGPEGAQEAEQLLRRSLTAEESAPAHAMLARLLALRGDFAGSFPHYAKAVELQPDMAPFFNEYGAALMSAGKLDEAASQFEAALKLDPRHEKARANVERLRQLRSATSSP